MEPALSYLDIENIDWGFTKEKVVSVGAAFEPLIHPKINELFNELNKQNAEIYLVTNGHNLNRKEIPALFDSHINTITFSFDGISQQTYETIRRVEISKERLIIFKNLLVPTKEEQSLLWISP